MEKIHTTSNEVGEFLTRRELAERWKCSVMTIKRRERDGLLKPLRSGRLVRYPLSQVLKLEDPTL